MNAHTPLQLAKAHCANWDNGDCKGIGIADDGSLFRFQSPRTCILGERGERCEYFEECVAPMAGSILNRLQRKAFEDALEAYRMAIARKRSQEARIRDFAPLIINDLSGPKSDVRCHDPRGQKQQSKRLRWRANAFPHDGAISVPAGSETTGVQ